jgi:hypothetical protein
MNRTLAFAAVFAAAMAVGASAQYGNPQEKSKSSRDRDNNKEVTVSGCLRSGDIAGTTGTTGSEPGSTSRSTASTRAQFYLANPTFTSGGPSSSSTTTNPPTTSYPTNPPTTPPPTGTTGNPTTGATTSGTEAANGIRLMGGDKDKLERLVNHQVEIKGRLEGTGYGSGAGSTSSTTGSTSSTAGSTSSTGATMASGMGQTLHVSSIKDIASTCSASQR